MKSWLCPLCGEKFLSSERLVIHFDDTHQNEFQVPDNAICLADYCDIVRCDLFIENEHPSSSSSSSTNQIDSSSSSKEAEPNLECDKDKLKELYEKCTRLIRQCTLGAVELENSMKKFNRLEKELSESICSYLTCEKYTDNNLEKPPKHISIKFLLIAILLIACLFSICYYFVWSLFENETELQFNVRLQSVCRAISLANLVKLAYLVNLVKTKWLCKKMNNKENKAASCDLNSKLDYKLSENLNGDLDSDLNKDDDKLINDELLRKQNQQTKSPFKMKQSIFSVRSSSSDSIKQMHLEHLKNLELHEKRIKELESLEKLNDNRNLSKEKIIEEENTIDDQFEENNEQANLKQQNQFNKRRFTNDSEIVSTKSEDFDKESFYEEAESGSFKKVNGLSSANGEEKDRRLSEQSICSNLTCPNRIKISVDDLSKNEEILDDEKKSKVECKENGKEDEQTKDEKEEKAITNRKRLWEIAGDITLLNQARLKLLEQRAASRQLNYQTKETKKTKENDQSKTICKKQAEIELKELAKSKQFEQNYQNNKINQKIMDQSLESRRRLYKHSSSSSTQTTNRAKSYLLCREDVPKNKAFNPLLNQVLFHHEGTRSQPPSLSQTPRPDSTNSHL